MRCVEADLKLNIIAFFAYIAQKESLRLLAKSAYYGLACCFDGENYCMMIEFTKYQGLGNDFILIDNRDTPKPIITPEQAIKICDRHFGIGADGVIFLLPPREGTDYTMRIFNSDGSEPEMCGNGIRCLARFVAELTGTEEIGQSYRIQTLAGVITPQLQANGQVTVDKNPKKIKEI